jgi:hypothetical protein
MKNKILITISLLGVCAYAQSDFVIIVDKKHNEYFTDADVWVDGGIRYTNWINVGAPFNCESWLPEMNNQKSDYNQSTNCDQNQERKKQHLEENKKTGQLRVVKEDLESKTVSQVSNRTVNVLSEEAYDVGSPYNCNTWSPLANTIYYGQSVNQSRSCSQSIEKIWNHIVDDVEQHTWTEAYSEQRSENQIAQGTKKHRISLKSCGYDQVLTGHCGSGNEIDTTYSDKSSVGRGWSVMVLNPVTFQQKDFRTYDTHADINLSTTMGQYLDSIAAGDLILIVTHDQPAYITSSFISSMSRNLKANTTFLNNIKLPQGSSSSNGYRSSYAIIAYKGGDKIAENGNYRYTDSSVSVELPR